MDIFIEVIVFLVLLFMFLFWKMWFSISRRRLIKKYNPELDMSGETHNDRNQKGGVFNARTDAEPDKGIDTIAVNTIGSEQPEGRELLQKTDVSDAREDSNSTRENSNSPRRRLFRRRTIRK